MREILRECFTLRFSFQHQLVRGQVFSHIGRGRDERRGMTLLQTDAIEEGVPQFLGLEGNLDGTSLPSTIRWMTMVADLSIGERLLNHIRFRVLDEVGDQLLILLQCLSRCRFLCTSDDDSSLLLLCVLGLLIDGLHTRLVHVTGRARERIGHVGYTVEAYRTPVPPRAAVGRGVLRGVISRWAYQAMKMAHLVSIRLVIRIVMLRILWPINSHSYGDRFLLSGCVRFIFPFLISTGRVPLVRVLGSPLAVISCKL
ncbi:hypothetical protein PRIPAC_91310 [Pristionchus pacificus]|uniref:Uncharacterized protein n=1 Tax=Pristionchus pacificus TaxID=54126 RepID=A0A2A6B7D6_PRIPA|nr:hypothetical protein PRIPAC_91310 [Pristionchus pacificus]|eukprot:PDM61792.1 hypothetical protein PRIPAC_51234 [Pristionchus pacificus]